MATTDFSGTPDAQMEHIMGLLESNPEFIPNVDERKAFVAEYFRRKKGGAAKPTPSPSGARPDNVESDLDAASSPLTPDPVVKPKPSPRDAYTAAAIEDGWTPEEAEMQANSEAGMQQGAFDPSLYNSPSARAQSRRGAARVHASTAAENRLDAGLAEAMGHNYDPAESSPLYQGGRAPANEDERRQRAAHGFLPGDTTTWDGVEVPVRMVDGRGRPMSTLGDLRRAKEAQDDARWLAGHRQLVAEERERYGDPMLPDTSDELTPQQYDNRNARRRAEANQRAQRQASRQYQIDHANDPLTPFEKQQKERRQLRSNMARLAGGSQNLNSGNNSFFQALAMLEGVDPGKMDAQQQAMVQMMPIDPRRAQMEAAHNAQLTQLGLRVATGQGFQGASDEARKMAQMKMDEAERAIPPEERAMKYRDAPDVHPSEVAMVDAHVSERYSAPGSVWGAGGLSSSFTTAEQQQTIDWLVNEKGYDPAKAQRIVDGIAAKRGSQSWFGNWE